MAYSESNASASAANDARCAQLNSGKFEIYDGTRPSNPDTAITSQNLLATLTFGNPAFGDSVDGVATANAIADATASATGTAAWARCYKSDGSSPVLDMNVGTSGSDLNLNSTSIQSGGTVSVTSMTVTQTPH